MQYRASIYLDLNAISKEEAEEKMKELIDIINSDDRFFDAYNGGIGEVVSGDLIGNNKRLSEIWNHPIQKRDGG